jgi:hypothetical protein
MEKKGKNTQGTKSKKTGKRNGKKTKERSLEGRRETQGGKR